MGSAQLCSSPAHIVGSLLTRGWAAAQSWTTSPGPFSTLDGSWLGPKLVSTQPWSCSIAHLGAYRFDRSRQQVLGTSGQAFKETLKMWQRGAVPPLSC